MDVDEISENITSALFYNSRNYVFTVNNYNDDSLKALLACKSLSYLVYGKEIAPSTGTPHLQGYVEFKRSMEFKSLKKLLPTAYLAKRKGTAQQASKYCMKAKDYIEHGTISKQGKRSDLADVVEMIESKATIQDIALACPEQYIKYNRGIEKLRVFHIPVRNTVPHVSVFYGPTGSQKTYRALQLMDPIHYVWYPQQGLWFDGYDGHDCVLFDEFRGQLPFGMMLNLLDRYDSRVQIKGGTSRFNATKIFITSPVHPREWYPHLEGNDKIDQLLRRLTVITQTLNN